MPTENLCRYSEDGSWFYLFLEHSGSCWRFFLAYFVTTKPTKTLEGSIDCVQAFSFEK
jgi:hypothetical protein